MSTYGAAIYNTSGVERLRFADPIVAVYAFTVSGSGSVTVPGVYAHAYVTLSPATSVLAPRYHCHVVTISSDDTITWHSDSYTIDSTLVFVNFCK